MENMARWVNVREIKRVFRDYGRGLEVPQSYNDDGGAYACNIYNFVAIRLGARAGETLAQLCAARAGEMVDVHSPFDPDL